ncbi:MAG: hypothetical protein ACI849_000820 [Patiriisocius sp.]|jgi:hypothetical protein
MTGFYKKFTFIILLVFVAISCKDDDGGETQDPKAENRKALGISAEDLLSADTYKSMTVELVYSPAYRPTQETLDAFSTFINTRVNKPNGVIFVETIISDQNGPFSIAQIRNIENEQRTHYTEGDDIAVYVYFASGNSNSDTNTTLTLGTAYQNTSIVIYESTLQEVTNNVQDILSRLESSTLQHEFGHIFGLVNIQNDDIHPGDEHEDLDHPKHCIIEDCLMYFEAQDITREQLSRNMQRLQRLGNIPEFDSNLCIKDLQAKGGK